MDGSAEAWVWVQKDAGVKLWMVGQGLGAFPGLSGVEMFPCGRHTDLVRVGCGIPVTWRCSALSPVVINVTMHDTIH